MNKSKSLLRELVKGAAFATAASILTPFNVLFVLRGLWPLVFLIGLLQLVLLGVGIYLMWSANKAARK